MCLQIICTQDKSTYVICDIHSFMLIEIHPSFTNPQKIHKHSIFIYIHTTSYQPRQSKHTGAILLIIISNSHDYQSVFNIYMTIHYLIHLLQSFPTCKNQRQNKQHRHPLSLFPDHVFKSHLEAQHGILKVLGLANWWVHSQTRPKLQSKEGSFGFQVDTTY